MAHVFLNLYHNFIFILFCSIFLYFSFPQNHYYLNIYIYISILFNKHTRSIFFSSTNERMKHDSDSGTKYQRARLTMRYVIMCIYRLPSFRVQYLLFLI